MKSISFTWDDHFVTGLANIDAQHRKLVDLVNDFGSVLGQPESVVLSEMEALFNELADYALYHFKEEEQVMARAGVDERHRAAQQRAHAHFLADVVRLRGELDRNNVAAGESLLRFLVNWLAYHILGIDQAMARQVAAIESGMSPAEAYAKHERLTEGNMEPILKALDGLFRQVSERNRELVELNQSLESMVAERTLALSQANRELEGVVARLKQEKEASTRLSDELASANQQLEHMAMTDVLTGLPNRRQALHRLQAEWDKAVREDLPLACMMIDADGFKPINDQFGHDAGDQVLRELSWNLRDSVRTDDVVCRLGGDEFFILCPRTPLTGARRVAELVLQAVNGLRVSVPPDGEWRGSVSIGVAARTPDMAHADDLLKLADEAVYRAKRGGRNRVESA